MRNLEINMNIFKVLILTNKMIIMKTTMIKVLMRMMVWYMLNDILNKYKI